MSAIYIFTGLFLLIKGWFILERIQNIGLGILLMVYGGFRSYRIYKTETAVKADNSDETVNSLDPTK